MAHSYSPDGRPTGIGKLLLIPVIVGLYGIIGLITFFLFTSPVFGVLAGIGFPAFFAGLIVGILSIPMFFIVILAVSFLGIIFSPGPVI